MFSILTSTISLSRHHDSAEFICKEILPIIRIFFHPVSWSCGIYLQDSIRLCDVRLLERRYRCSRPCTDQALISLGFLTLTPHLTQRQRMGRLNSLISSKLSSASDVATHSLLPQPCLNLNPLKLLFSGVFNFFDETSGQCGKIQSSVKFCVPYSMTSVPDQFYC